MPGEDSKHELRSFGRRRGRKPSDRQEDLKRELLPKMAVDLSSPPTDLDGPNSDWLRTTPTGNKETPPPAQAELGFAKTWGKLGGGESQKPAIGVRSTASTGIPPTPNPSPRRAESAPSAQWGGGVPRWLEIGFGGGEHLVWQARNNPGVRLIGCEPFEDGVVKVLTAIEDDRLENIRIHMGDARDVLRWLPEASIARAFILFPDPWPKRKHRKRRLVNGQTLSLLARVLKPGAELRIGTDIGDYARTMLLAVQSETRFQWLAEGPQDWRVRPADWPETRYEQKAEREGRVRYYFRFARV